ncbi:hypothetical protein ABBQ32_002781 [Trebouxia sp. C0010 RCD-2024]
MAYGFQEDEWNKLHKWEKTIAQKCERVASGANPNAAELGALIQAVINHLRTTTCCPYIYCGHSATNTSKLCLDHLTTVTNKIPDNVDHLYHWLQCVKTSGQCHHHGFCCPLPTQLVNFDLLTEQMARNQPPQQQPGDGAATYLAATPGPSSSIHEAASPSSAIAHSGFHMPSSLEDGERQQPGMEILMLLPDADSSTMHDDIPPSRLDLLSSLEAGGPQLEGSPQAPMSQPDAFLNAFGQDPASCPETSQQLLLPAMVMREVEFPFTQPFEQLLDSQNALRSAFRFFIEQNSSRDRLSLTLAAVQALNEVWFYSGSLIAFVRQEQLSTSPDQFLESISQQLPAQQLEGDATLQLGTSLWQLDASGTVQHHTLDADKLPIVCKAQYGKRVPGLGTELFVQIRNQQRDTELKLYVHTSCQAVTVKAPLAEEGVADDLQCPRGRGDAEGHWLQLILPEDAPPVLLVEMLNGPWASQQTIVDQAEAAARWWDTNHAGISSSNAAEERQSAGPTHSSSTSSRIDLSNTGSKALGVSSKPKTTRNPAVALTQPSDVPQGQSLGSQSSARARFRQVKADTGDPDGWTFMLGFLVWFVVAVCYTCERAVNLDKLQGHGQRTYGSCVLVVEVLGMLPLVLHSLLLVVSQKACAPKTVQRPVKLQVLVPWVDEDMQKMKSVLKQVIAAAEHAQQDGRHLLSSVTIHVCEDAWMQGNDEGAAVAAFEQSAEDRALAAHRALIMSLRMQLIGSHIQIRQSVRDKEQGSVHHSRRSKNLMKCLSELYGVLRPATSNEVVAVLDAHMPPEKHFFSTMLPWMDVGYDVALVPRQQFPAAHSSRFNPFTVLRVRALAGIQHWGMLKGGSLADDSFVVPARAIFGAGWCPGYPMRQTYVRPARADFQQWQAVVDEKLGAPPHPGSIATGFEAELGQAPYELLFSAKSVNERELTFWQQALYSAPEQATCLSLVFSLMSIAVPAVCIWSGFLPAAPTIQLVAWYTVFTGLSMAGKCFLCLLTEFGFPRDIRHYWEANMPVGDFLAALFWTLTLRDTVAPFDAFVRWRTGFLKPAHGTALPGRSMQGPYRESSEHHTAAGPAKSDEDLSSSATTSAGTVKWRQQPETGISSHNTQDARGARGSSEGSYQAKAEIGQQQGQQPAARPRTGQPLHGLHLAKQLLPDALVGGIPLGQLTGPYTHQKRRGQCIWMYTLSHACRLWEAGSALFKANVPIRLLL